MSGETLGAVEIIEDAKLLTKNGAAGRVIQPEAMDLGLGGGPGLHDDPGRLHALGLQLEIPLEAVNQEEATLFFDDHQWMVNVGAGPDFLGIEEIEADAREGNQADGHAWPERLPSAGESERTWKVG